MKFYRKKLFFTMLLALVGFAHSYNYYIRSSQTKAFIKGAPYDVVNIDLQGRQAFVFTENEIYYSLSNIYIDSKYKSLSPSERGHGIAFYGTNVQFTIDGYTNFVIYILQYKSCDMGIYGIGGKVNNIKFHVNRANVNTCIFTPTFLNVTTATYSIGMSDDLASGTYRLGDIDTNTVLVSTTTTTSYHTSKHVYGLYQLPNSIFSHKFKRSYSQPDESFSTSCIESGKIYMCDSQTCINHNSDITLDNFSCLSNVSVNISLIVGIVVAVAIVIIILPILCCCGVFAACGIGCSYGCSYHPKHEDTQQVSYPPTYQSPVYQAPPPGYTQQVSYPPNGY